MLSVAEDSSTGNFVLLDDETCQIEKTTYRSYGPLGKELFALDATSCVSDQAAYVALGSNIKSGNQRLSHVHTKGIRLMVKNDALHGITLNKNAEIQNYSGCINGKISAEPIPKILIDRSQKYLTLYALMCVILFQ